jgi:hypothetical protein
MEEALTLTRLSVSGNLTRTLERTNPIESMIEIVRWTQRNVKRWSPGEMALRWTAGMPEARTAIPEDHRLPRPRHPHRDRARPPPATHRSPPNQGGRYRRRCLTSTADRRHETERSGHGKGHRDELGDA